MRAATSPASSPCHPFAAAGAAALAVLLAVPLSGQAQGTATVKVGNQTKQTAGTVVRIDDGDTACHVSFKGEQGAGFDERADFSICENKRSYIGKRVNIRYRMDRVMADECQGDVQCKKTQTVALIAALTVVDAKPAAAAPVARTEARQASFCTPNETVVFACRTGAKMVSVCASRDAAPNKGYLQYRFGRPDSAEPLELSFPNDHRPPSRVATGRNEPFAGGGGAWLRMRQGQHAYVVYTGIGRWGPQGQTVEKQGLVVQRGDKVLASLRCSGPVTSELGPDWFEQMGVKAGEDEEFIFP